MVTSILAFISFVFGYAVSSLLHRLSLVATSWSYSLVAMCERLTAVASLVVENGLWSAWAAVFAARGLQLLWFLGCRA